VDDDEVIASLRPCIACQRIWPGIQSRLPCLCEMTVPPNPSVILHVTSRYVSSRSYTTNIAKRAGRYSSVCTLLVIGTGTETRIRVIDARESIWIQFSVIARQYRSSSSQCQRYAYSEARTERCPRLDTPWPRRLCSSPMWWCLLHQFGLLFAALYRISMRMLFFKPSDSNRNDRMTS